MYSSIDIACIEQPHINEGFLMETMRSSSTGMCTSFLWSWLIRWMTLARQMEKSETGMCLVLDQWQSVITEAADLGVWGVSVPLWMLCWVLSVWKFWAECLVLVSSLRDGTRKLHGVAASREQLCSWGFRVTEKLGQRAKQEFWASKCGDEEEEFWRIF